MRIEVVLIYEIPLVIFANVMVQQGNGHDQGYIAHTVVINDLQ